MEDKVLVKEWKFYDVWVLIIDIEGIWVVDYFESCIVLENRFIFK